eukprot:TRINITY_DN15646_c0_g1_i1.p1 TRINITY_DN15646_c0_g1~~TRINITY_DN15646_c0_g1_i1.p1  ORF type:complete len:327 (+),score=51.49 TRINITY_DN15646_c0_g1_i1:34-1014(+)
MSTERTSREGVSPLWRLATISLMFLLLLFAVERPVYPTAAQRHGLGCKTSDELGNTQDSGGVFFEIAQHHLNTDKVYPHHHYEGLYGKYLDALRTSPSINFLEIGLGCNMPAGPGHSVELWRQFFGEERLRYTVLEYTQCLDKWKSIVKKSKPPHSTQTIQWYQQIWDNGIYWGDQADRELLLAMTKNISQPLDVVVDDGGHTMNQQITSFETLFPFVKPGGLYFIEDLETSFMRGEWGGDAISHIRQTTTVGYINRIITDLHWRSEHHLVSSTHNPTKWSNWIRSVDCDRMICVITKRKTPYKAKHTERTFPCTRKCRGEYCSCR